MKRLTRKKLGNTNGKEFVLCNHREDDCNDSCRDGTCEWNRKALLKLKKYEDTGVAPEKLKIIDEEYSRMAKELSMLRQQNRWIPVSDALPTPEEEILIITKRGIVTTAFYEDGTMAEDDSCWTWYAADFDYDEETDTYYIPAGWWEYRHFNDDEVYNNTIDEKVLAWMPMPEPYKEQK